MDLKQKSFLDDLAKLFDKYNIDSVQADDDGVVFYSNRQPLRFSRYVWTERKFLNVMTNYKAEIEEEKTFEESELNDD